MRPMSVRVLTVAALLPVMVACSATSGSTTQSAGASSPSPAASSARPVTPPLPDTLGPGIGAVTGSVRVYGGPLNPTTRKQALNGDPLPHALVTATGSAGGRHVARTDKRGGFILRLAAGRYTLSSDCAGVAVVVVRAGATLHQDIVCSVP
jgi:ABC-type transport system substrate-binding protein